MKKYSKKVALILVLALVLAAAIPALAANKTVITGNYKAQELNVLVPTTTTAVINPYCLPVKLDDAGHELEKPGQIATLPLVGANLGDLDLSVGATVIGKTTGNFKFATTAPAATVTTNSGLVYLEMKKAGDLAYTASSDVEVFGHFGADAVTNELNDWDVETYNKNTMLLVSTTAASKTGMCTIAKADETTGAPQSDSYFVARLGGNVVQRPAKEWTEKDGFTATITWIFEPATE